MDLTGVKDLDNIIYNYKYQMEVIDKYNNVLEELKDYMKYRKDEVVYVSDKRLLTVRNKINGVIIFIIHLKEKINIFPFNLIKKL
jgi:hypothetical protein